MWLMTTDLETALLVVLMALVFAVASPAPPPLRIFSEPTPQADTIASPFSRHMSRIDEKFEEAAELDFNITDCVVCISSSLKAVAW